MPLTPQEVAGKVFGPTRLRRGYDENEVDAFLDQIETELTRLTTDNERLRRELEQARRAGAAGYEPGPSEQVAAASVASADVPSVAESEPAVTTSSTPAVADDLAVEQRAARMLVLAQQTADAAVHDAQAEADRARGSARTEAERILSEARGQAAAEVGSLERTKNALESEVEQLQSFEREYRQRLRAYLQMQLRDLEIAGAAAVEPDAANALDSGSSFESAEGPGGGLAVDVEPEPEPDPLSTGLSDPPGFGAVWSPGAGGYTGADPVATGERENEESSGGSPFDTGGEDQRGGGFGSL